MLKVSVVVPTYRSGEGLDRLVASLDAQTMPTDEFEVVFVDDGSPDDTFERLLGIQSTRPHVRLERIENSGWPCRPRNVGTDLAEGEYVAYMDHDDLLYPDALRAAYEFAKSCGADVVNGKEARTHDAAWAIDTYRADETQSIGRVDQHPLIPMNPHKLYRRQFLDDHGIRFREGGRVMWEDIFFNLLVDKHAKTIATMSSTSYYHWFMTPGSGSKGFLRSGDEFWHWLREVLVATEAELADDALALARTQLMTHQYSHRLLGSFDGRFAGRPPEDRDLIYGHCRALQADFALDRFDERLSSSARIRAALLHADERELLERVPAHDPGIPGWGEAVSATWSEGRLDVSVRAEWSSPKGRRHALRRSDGRILKVLPSEFERALPPGVLDVTDEIVGARIEVGVRSRASRIVWMAPTRDELSVDDRPDLGVVFGATADAAIDPDTIVFGRPLEPGLWDLNLRCTLAGSPTQRALLSTVHPSGVLGEFGVRLVYANADGALTLALDQPDEAIRRLMPAAGGATFVQAGDRAMLTVPLEGIDPVGPSARDVPVHVAVAPAAKPFAFVRDRRSSPFRESEGVLRAVDGRVELEVAFPAGTTSARVRLGALHPNGRQWWTANADGRFSAGPATTSRRPLAARVRSAIRRVRNRLR